MCCKNRSWALRLHKNTRVLGMLFKWYSNAVSSCSINIISTLNDEKYIILSLNIAMISREPRQTRFSYLEEFGCTSNKRDFLATEASFLNEPGPSLASYHHSLDFLTIGHLDRWQHKMFQIDLAAHNHRNTQQQSVRPRGNH